MVFSYRETKGDFPMTANNRSIQSRSASTTRRIARTMPLAIALLAWLFAATTATGYVAVLNSGIQQTGQSGQTA